MASKKMSKSSKLSKQSGDSSKNSAPKIVVLHGWALESDVEEKWQDTLSLLREHHQTDFLHLPGFKEPISEPWDLDDYVTWVTEQLPKNQRVVLIGHSFGGQIAARLAAKHPNSIHSLVLISSSGVRSHTLPAVIKRRVFWIVAKLGKRIVKSKSAKNLLYFLAREQDYAKSKPVMRETMKRVLKQEITKELHKIQAPTLLIWGSLDKVTPLFIAEKMLARIPDSRLQIVQNARHSPVYTHPKETVDIITEFLKTQL